MSKSLYWLLLGRTLNLRLRRSHFLFSSNVILMSVNHLVPSKTFPITLYIIHIFSSSLILLSFELNLNIVSKSGRNIWYGFGYIFFELTFAAFRWKFAEFTILKSWSDQWSCNFEFRNFWLWKCIWLFFYILKILLYELLTFLQIFLQKFIVKYYSLFHYWIFSEHLQCFQ